MKRALEIGNRLKELKQEIEDATLIAVSKNNPVEDVVYAYEAGQIDFGENKVFELKDKADFFSAQNKVLVKWHFIGHLQTNKVKELLKIPQLYAIHSISSLKILAEIKKQKNLFKGPELKLFLQVNTSLEAEKSGFMTMQELEEAVIDLSGENSNLKLYGLMTMGTYRTEDFLGEAKRCFNELKNIKETLEKKYQLGDLKLSMGMSQDYQIALENGADYIRIGSNIFKK